MAYVAPRALRDSWLDASSRAVPLFGIGVPGLGDIAQDVTGFPASVLRWKPLLAKYGAGIPMNFLLAWIKRESNGNPCSYTSLRESGIFQLMPPYNTNTGGTTEAALRAACSGSTQQLARSLTPAEAELQVSSGIRYVRAQIADAKKKLAAAGVSWPETSGSFWAFVKLQHAYPAPSLGWLKSATAALGRPPRSFAEMRSTINGYATVLENAEWTGRYGEGGAGSPLATLALAGGAVLLYYLWQRDL